jgi:hypothetical protein
VTEVHPGYLADRVYLRDASWHNSPSTSAGPRSHFASKYHWSRPDDPALAACSRRIVVCSIGVDYQDTNTPGDAPDDVANTQRCRRRGCTERWTAWDDNEWYRTWVAGAVAEWVAIKDQPHTGAGEDLCALCWAGDGDPRCQRCGCSVGMPGCQCTEGYLGGPCHSLVVGVGPGLVTS